MIDFEIKVPRRVSSHKNYSKSNYERSNISQISFVSYVESLRGLSQSLISIEKQKFSYMLNPFIHEASDLNGMSEMFINDNKKISVNNFQKFKSKSKQQKIHQNFINEAHDESEKSNLNLSHQVQEINPQDSEFETRQFTHEERQSLKNAFRYICRLVFKQAHKYSEKMSQLYSTKEEWGQKNSHLQQEKQQRKSKRQRSSLSIGHATLSQLNLLQQAELISGQRYFKQFLQRLQLSQRKILLKYMIWFLRNKYLRYINKCNNENKGKRKQMKKDLYIRFKNITMLPYLQALLIDISHMGTK